MKAFENALVYTEDGLVKTTVLFDSRILAIGAHNENAEPAALPQGAIVVPGFIDEHIHGAGGADAMDGTHAALATIAKTVAQEGTTAFCATTMTQSPANIKRALEAAREYREHPACGARLLGVHLEGPFISAKHKGAQPLEYVAKPDPAVFEDYLAASGNTIRIVSLAPEEEGAAELMDFLHARGILISVGHSGAKFADVENAVLHGATHVTHTYNAQSPLHHREAGVVGAALLLDELSAELICDGIHVSVPAMKLLAKCKPEGKLILITDAIRAKGLGDGVSELGGQTVYVKNGEARLADGTLAGSVLRMNEAVRNLVQRVGVPFERAVDAATKDPARDLGILGEAGTISVGKRADFTVLDADFRVLLTVVGGETVYTAQ